MSRITDKNIEVFRRGRYFSEPEGIKTGKIAAVSEERERTFERVTQIASERTPKSHEVKTDMVKEETELPTVVFEEIGQEQEIPARVQNSGVQEISDEVERLSFRYGRGMEEWLA